MMRQRRRPSEVEIKSLTACSTSHLMWPLVRYHACNVLDAGESIWNSGKFAPASIRIKLTDGPMYVTRLELQVEMSPTRANVHHEIHAGISAGTMRVIGCVKGLVSHGSWIHVAVKDEVECLEINTLDSPSFVAWRCIRVFGHQSES